uniref:Uncharacterized protein n=1 Tax=Lepeophtheirus salmonis TaxID=72036 RepID=A0A0K2TL36_LEPSM
MIVYHIRLYAYTYVSIFNKFTTCAADTLCL